MAPTPTCGLTCASCPCGFVADILLLETIAFRICETFVLNPDCISCIYGLVLQWKHLTALHHPAAGHKKYVWLVVELIILTFETNKPKKFINIQNQINNISPKVGSVKQLDDVVRFLYTKIVISYYEQKNKRKARITLRDKPVLYGRELYFLLNNTEETEELLQVQNIRKHIVGFVKSCMDKLGKPQLYSLIEKLNIFESTSTSEPNKNTCSTEGSNNRENLNIYVNGKTPVSVSDLLKVHQDIDRTKTSSSFQLTPTGRIKKSNQQNVPINSPKLNHRKKLFCPSSPTIRDGFESQSANETRGREDDANKGTDECTNENLPLDEFSPNFPSTRIPTPKSKQSVTVEDFLKIHQEMDRTKTSSAFLISPAGKANFMQTPCKSPAPSSPKMYTPNTCRKRLWNQPPQIIHNKIASPATKTTTHSLTEEASAIGIIVKGRKLLTNKNERDSPPPTKRLALLDSGSYPSTTDIPATATDSSSDNCSTSDPTDEVNNKTNSTTRVKRLAKRRLRLRSKMQKNENKSNSLIKEDERVSPPAVKSGSHQSSTKIPATLDSTPGSTSAPTHEIASNTNNSGRVTRLAKKRREMEVVFVENSDVETSDDDTEIAIDDIERSVIPNTLENIGDDNREIIVSVSFIDDSCHDISSNWEIKSEIDAVNSIANNSKKDIVDDNNSKESIDDIGAGVINDIEIEFEKRVAENYKQNLAEIVDDSWKREVDGEIGSLDLFNHHEITVCGNETTRNDLRNLIQDSTESNNITNVTFDLKTDVFAISHVQKTIQCFKNNDGRTMGYRNDSHDSEDSDDDDDDRKNETGSSDSENERYNAAATPNTNLSSQDFLDKRSKRLKVASSKRSRDFTNAINNKSHDRTTRDITPVNNKSRDRTTRDSTAVNNKSRDRTTRDSTAVNNKSRDRTTRDSTAVNNKSRDRTTRDSTAVNNKSHDPPRDFRNAINNISHDRPRVFTPAANNKILKTKKQLIEAILLL